MRHAARRVPTVTGLKEEGHNKAVEAWAVEAAGSRQTEEDQEAEGSSCSCAADIVVVARLRSAGPVGHVVGCLLSRDTGSPSLRSSLGSDGRAVAGQT